MSDEPFKHEQVGWILIGMGWGVLIIAWLFLRGSGIVFWTIAHVLAISAFIVGILRFWKAIRGEKNVVSEKRKK